MNQGLSIIICKFNGKSCLGPTLTHLAALALLTDHAAELIVVDNASTDDTGPFVSSLWQKLSQPFALRILLEPRPGKGYAVETGFDTGRYSHILTVDDDNWLQADYLTTAAELLRQHPDVSVLQGHSLAVMEEAPPPWFGQVQWYFITGGASRRAGSLPAAISSCGEAEWLFGAPIGCGCTSWGFRPLPASCLARQRAKTMRWPSGCWAEKSTIPWPA